jgi:hypothetical protein
MVHLRGLQDANFLLMFEGATDPRERSKIVGQRISELRASFLKSLKPREESWPRPLKQN